MDTNDDVRPGDLLVGAAAIRAYLVGLGMPENTDPYYLRRSGQHWPIGSTAPGGGRLVASKTRLSNFIMKIARGSSAA